MSQRRGAARAAGPLALAAACLALAAAPAAALPAGAPPATAPATGQPATRATPAPAGAVFRQLHFGVRLADVPLDEARNPRALQYIIDFLPTGSLIRRRIMIVNDEQRTARFTVYPGAAQIAGGEFTGAAGHARNELTSWITVAHPSVTIGPGRSAMDTVTIAVPRSATRAEHYAVIWAQQSESVRPGEHVTIGEVARAGIRVYLAVGPGGLPATSFTITSVTGQRAGSGQPQFITGVRNTGGRAVDLTGQLSLARGPGGSSAGPFGVARAVTLGPGQPGTVAFALPAALPAGSWTATVTLVSGLTRATARAAVSFNSPVASAPWEDPVAMSWAGGMLAGLLVIAVVAAARLRRLRRLRQERPAVPSTATQREFPWP
jgi:hypothetical protein